MFKSNGSKISLHLHESFVVTSIKLFILVIGPNLYNRAIVTSIKIMAVIGSKTSIYLYDKLVGTGTKLITFVIGSNTVLHLHSRIIVTYIKVSAVIGKNINFNLHKYFCM